ncbi:hypothetical protein STEG23_027292, partial [Scotinomys teguina]
GRALLHWACDRGHKELVTVLLQYEADINCQALASEYEPYMRAAALCLEVLLIVFRSDVKCLSAFQIVSLSRIAVGIYRDRLRLVAHLLVPSGQILLLV